MSTRTGMRDSSGRSVKHVPQRTCIACRQVKVKRELVRLVRVPGGAVEADTTGKKPGRGAYLCRQPECWEAGLRSGRLEYALKIALAPGNREQLAKYGQGLLEGAGSGSGK